MSVAADAIPDHPPVSSATTVPRALSSVQERRLTDYLDEKILEIQREYKKREYESSSLRTLSAYIKAIRPLLILILMIPPVAASVHLRASLLLRLTGEVLECITGYTESGSDSDLSELTDILTDLDRGWLAVLRSQTWNVASREGTDLILPSDADFTSTPISQTDRTRLRSLLILGTDKLEQWLEELGPIATPQWEERTEEQVLKVTEARERFDDLFHQTLSEMGELQGTVPILNL